MNLGIAIASAAALGSALHAGTEEAVFQRVELPARGIVWDAPACDSADRLGGIRWSRSWSVAGDGTAETCTNARLSGNHVPAARVSLKTIDPEGDVPRTRIDQPFTVEIELSGLLSDMQLPDSVSKVMLERQLRTAGTGPANIQQSLLASNGLTRLRFPSSSLLAEDPTKANGEEEFTVHSLSGDGKTPTRIGGGVIRVHPVASGMIEGIAPGARLRETPSLTVTLNDLYPTSETRLMVFSGTQVNGSRGVVVSTRRTNGEECVDAGFRVTDLGRHLEGAGTYTLALISDTVYGRELLAEPVTFHLEGPLREGIPTELAFRGSRR